MGLDMYLYGTKSNWNTNSTADGFEVDSIKLKLGYWRKHPDLHGFIVNNFAEGEDNCEEIALSKADLQRIIAAIKTKSLPKTRGFFFGESTPDRDQGTIETFERAMTWLDEKIDGVFKSVHYMASW